jgi:protein TonB
MMRRWRIAAADPRSRLWLTSAVIHVGLVAIIVIRTPYGLADHADARLATAPQVELGLLPLPASGQNPETVAATEPAPLETEPEAPQQPAEMAAEPEAPQQPTEMAALPPALYEPPVDPAAEDAVPTKEVDEEPQPQEKSIKDTISKPQPKPEPKSKPKPRERKTKPVPREHANDGRRGATAARASGTMSGAQANHAQTGAAQANYGALLRAEIMRRRIYPAEAASRGDQGTVTARVTIGPNGTAVSHAVVRGSGIASFDRVVPQIMSRLSLPPPPGGRYTATVAIRFALD